MGKVLRTHYALDDEVAGLVTRVGALEQPKNHIVNYTVERYNDGPTLVTVRFIADENFSPLPTPEPLPADNVVPVDENQLAIDITEGSAQ